MAATEYTIRRKILTLLGAKFHVYDESGNLVGFCKQKAFKLKEDIRVYTDESMADERLVISARKAIDFSAAYDVVDSREGSKLGALRRKGMKSLLRDEWQLLDENDEEVGLIQEDSTALALVRRFRSNLVPQKHVLRDYDGDQLAIFRTHFNPFVHRMTVTVLPDCPVHPLMILGAGILLAAIEGRQSG